MPTTPTGLVIPPSAVIHGKQPKHVCRICGAVFYEGEERARIRHLKECVRANEAEIHEAASESYLDSVFGEGDPEKASWLKRRYEQLKGKVSDPTNPRHY